MVRVHAGVDDVADGKRGETPNRRDHPIGGFRGARVDQDDAHGPDLRQNVPPGPAQQEKIRPKLDDGKALARCLLSRLLARLLLLRHDRRRPTGERKR